MFPSCQTTEEKLQSERWWKYGGGHHIGDILVFNAETTCLKKDTIYQNDTAVALLLDIESRLLSGDKVLHIKDLNSAQKGRYISK